MASCGHVTVGDGGLPTACARSDSYRWRLLPLSLSSSHSSRSYPVQAVVSSAEAEGLARQLGVRFFRVAVKDNLNVAEGEGSCMGKTGGTLGAI